MVSQRTRNLVGQSCRDVSRFGLRCETLVNRYIRRRDFLRVAMLVAVIGSAASLFTPLNHPAATAVLAIAAAVLALVEYELNLAKRNEVLRLVNVDAGRLKADWNDLRIRMDDEDADDSEIRAEDRRLKVRLIDAERRIREERIVADNKRESKTPTVSAIPRRPPPPPAPPPPPRRPAPAPKKP